MMMRPTDTFKDCHENTQTGSDPQIQLHKTPTILISAGGTGGHLFPALTVAECLVRAGWRIIWVGAKDKLESHIVPARGHEFHGLSIRSLRDRGFFSRLKTAASTGHALMQMIQLLQTHRPDCVLGMGGFTAGPAGLAARLLRVPLVIHEQNALPGLTNRWLSKWATRILTGYPNVFPTGVWTGNPVRSEIENLPPKKSPTGTVNILVLGGSAGAKAINRCVPFLKKRWGDRVSLWHQTGEKWLAEADTLYTAAGVKPDRLDPFIDSMADAYRFADIVIARAGAMTVAEILTARIPAIFIPYPLAVDDHQYHNAKPLVDAGAARLIRNDDLTPERLITEIESLMEDPSTWHSMHAAVCTLTQKPHAAEHIADMCQHTAHFNPQASQRDHSHQD